MQNCEPNFKEHQFPQIIENAEKAVRSFQQIIPRVNWQSHIPQCEYPPAADYQVCYHERKKTAQMALNALHSIQKEREKTMTFQIYPIHKLQGTYATVEASFMLCVLSHELVKVGEVLLKAYCTHAFCTQRQQAIVIQSNQAKTLSMNWLFNMQIQFLKEISSTTDSHKADLENGIISIMKCQNTCREYKVCVQTYGNSLRKTAFLKKENFLAMQKKAHTKIQEIHQFLPKAIEGGKIFLKTQHTLEQSWSHWTEAIDCLLQIDKEIQSLQAKDTQDPDYLDLYTSIPQKCKDSSHHIRQWSSTNPVHHFLRLALNDLEQTFRYVNNQKLYKEITSLKGLLIKKEKKCKKI